jgi:pilus assembly protein CpaF
VVEVEPDLAPGRLDSVAPIGFQEAWMQEYSTDTAPSAESLSRLRPYLVQKINQGLAARPSDVPRSVAARQILEMVCRHKQIEMSQAQRDRLFSEILSEFTDLAEIQPLLDDPTITEIMVNGPENVYVEREGRIEPADVRFSGDQAIFDLIDRIVLPLGRRIDAQHPTVDARLPDGSRVNAVIPPAAIDGPSLTIRKFAREKLQFDDLINLGSLTAPIAEFLEACVLARLNILVSGGTGSGKTTLLNILSGAIPESERIITIEDAAELQLHQVHRVRLEAKPPDVDGQGEVTIRHLVRNALRMRPDRIIVGEVRGGEALDMLQAMNTGHDGSLTTVHANNPRDAISRLETLVLLSGFDLPLRVVREQISSAVDLIVQQARFSEGSRKLISITEVMGMEGETVVLNELFKLPDNNGNGHGSGIIAPTGIRPMFEPRLKVVGYHPPPELFGADLMQLRPTTKRR